VSDQLSDYGLAARARGYMSMDPVHIQRAISPVYRTCFEGAVVSRTDSNPRGPSAMPSCPVVQQLDGRLDAAG
jgi:hypothetical protein